MNHSQSLLHKAIHAKRESRFVDFKASFDPDIRGEYCELIKDIVAMANSGGGVIVLGVNDNGSHSGADLDKILKLDPAFWTDKVAAYTNVQFSDIELEVILRDRKQVAALVIPEASLPIIFTQPGTYAVDQKKQQSAFARGSLYFRHGAKSEPGTNEDIRRAMDRVLDRVRTLWSKGIRKVVEAPQDHVVQVVPATAQRVASLPGGAARVVSDPSAPGFHPENADEKWPHRMKDVIRLVKEQLPGASFSGHDVMCIRKLDDLERTRKDFLYRPFKISPPQYSDELVNWLVQNMREDPEFCQKYRDRFRASTTSDSAQTIGSRSS